jgi:heme A synthase
MARVLKISSRPQASMVWMPYAALALVIALALPIMIGAMRAVQALELMQADIHNMDERLASLDAMDRKLNTLTAMSRSLDGFHGQLGMMTDQLVDANGAMRLTNRKLDVADGSLGATTTSIGRMTGAMLAMQGQLKTIAAMRGDLHTAVHKISGSFLFKGVK